MSKVLPWALVLVLGAAFLFRSKPVPPIPQIVTKYDTVTKIDTQWVKKLSHDTLYKHDTVVVEKKVTQVPETTKVFITETGVTAVKVGEHRGDTTNVLFFSTAADDTAKGTFIKKKYLWQSYTAGPLKSLVVLSPTQLAVDYYDPPKACHEIQYAAKGAVAGAGLIVLLRAALGH